MSHPALSISARPILLVLIFFGFFPGFCQYPEIHPFDAQEYISRSSHNLIAESYGRQRITRDQMVLYHGYALTAPGKLPEEYRSRDPEKCGTWVAELIRNEWDELLPETREILERDCGFTATGTLGRPAGLGSQQGTTHFLIHYSVVRGDTNMVDTTDNDANGTPDYVDKFMVYAEEAWNQEIVSLGYYPPPHDLGAGGDNRIDIYLIKTNSYGICYREQLVIDNPNSPVTEHNAFTSFIVLRNDYESTSGTALEVIMKTTVAHEFFHSIQDGYDGYEELWLKEATATWIEEQIYDEYNYNLIWLDQFFRNPWISLDANAQESLYHMYGSWIFFRFLSEFYLSPTIVRDIWEKAVLYVDYPQSRKSFHAINHALSLYGSNFESIFRLFTLANLFPWIEYKDGDLYPRINRTRDPIGSFSYTTYLPRRAADYYRVSPNIVPRGIDAIEFRLTRIDPLIALGGQVVTRRGETIETFPFTHQYTLTPTEDIDEIFLIVMNYDSLGTNFTYKLDITTHSQVQQLSYTHTWMGGHRWFYVSHGKVTWKDMRSAFYYDGERILMLTTTKNPSEPPALDSCYLAYRTSRKIGNPPQTMHGVQFSNGNTAAFIYSDKWRILDADFNSSDILMDRGTLFFAMEDLESHKYYIVSKKWCEPEKKITDSLPFKPLLHQSENGSLIWQERSGVNYPSDIRWYNGQMNLYTYAKHRWTIPIRCNEEQAWIESYTDTWLGPDSTWELFHFNEKTTSITHITNDEITDGPVEAYGQFSIGKGKIAWPRRVPTFLSGLGLPYAHVYENGSIRVLRDETTHMPYLQTFNIRVDRKKGYVVWVGVSYNESLKRAESNLYVWNGHQMFTALPPGFFDHDGFIPFEVDDGLLVFARSPKDTDSNYVYICHVDSVLTSIGGTPSTVQESRRLLICYPNPFASDITFDLSLPTAAMVRLSVCNCLGEEVGCPVNHVMPGGRHSIAWQAGHLAPGVYFATMTAGQAKETRKIILVR